MLKQVIETWVKLIVIQYNEDSKLSLGLSCFVFWSTCWMILCTLSVILWVDLCLACVCCVCTAWARVLPACDWLNWQRYEIWGFGIIVLSWVFVCTSLKGDNNLIASYTWSPLRRARRPPIARWQCARPCRPRTARSKCQHVGKSLDGLEVRALVMLMLLLLIDCPLLLLLLLLLVLYYDESINRCSWLMLISSLLSVPVQRKE